LANNGLDFLDSRTEFWRQQKPIYARKSGAMNSSSHSSSETTADRYKNPLPYVLKQLEIIDNCKIEFCLKKTNLNLFNFRSIK
jgi:tetratricopeptide repeat protein 25